MKDKNDVQFMHCLLADFRSHDTDTMICSTKLKLFIEVEKGEFAFRNYFREEQHFGEILTSGCDATALIYFWNATRCACEDVLFWIVLPSLQQSEFHPQAFSVWKNETGRDAFV